MQKRMFILTLALLSIVAFGCAENEAEEPAGATELSTVPVTETVTTTVVEVAEAPALEPEPQLPPVDVCGLLSDAQLDEMAGTDMTAGRPSTTGEGASICTWVAPAGGTLVARVYDSAPGDVWNTITAPLPGFEPVEGIGDRAAANEAYRLFVAQKGPRTLVVDLTQLAGDPEANGATFARIAVPKL